MGDQKNENNIGKIVYVFGDKPIEFNDILLIELVIF
jgi:hypothetical protein